MSPTKSKNVIKYSTQQILFYTSKIQIQMNKNESDHSLIAINS